MQHTLVDAAVVFDLFQPHLAAFTTGRSRGTAWRAPLDYAQPEFLRGECRLRGWLTAVAIACVLSGMACSAPVTHPGVAAKPSGSATTSSPPPFVAAAGDCFSSRGSYLTAAEKVPCSAHHWAEEAYVGTFTGSVAALTVPPVANSNAVRDAYGRCTVETARYVGGDWHAALMELELEVPDPDAWTAGARWFHCELWSILSLNLIEPEAGSTISFRGLLRKSTPLSIRCITWKGANGFDDWSDYEPAPCSSPHRGEFVGAYTAPAGPWPSTDTARKIADRGCEALVAHYVGFPSWRQLNNPYVGYLQLGFRESQWDMGSTGRHGATSPRTPRITNSLAA
jgi:hypothetical protein